MTQEEKAKRYDEAIEIAKEINNEQQAQPFNVMTRVFPELAEIEDERIRKDIISFVEQAIDAGYGIISKERKEKWITWLEKQGEKVEPIESFNSEFERQISHLIASIINKEHEYTEAFVKWTSDALLNYAKHEIDKQGAQKSTNKVEPKFKIGDYVKNVNDKREPIYEIVYMDKECYICEYRGKERMGDKAVMHFAFDNPYLRLVEPKFKIGDYIERKDGLGCHAKIIFVGGNVYGCEKLIYTEDSSPFFKLMFENQDEFRISSGFQQKPVEWSKKDSLYYDDICEILINLLHSESPNVNKSAIQKDLDWFITLVKQTKK